MRPMSGSMPECDDEGPQGTARKRQLGVKRSMKATVWAARVLYLV